MSKHNSDKVSNISMEKIYCQIAKDNNVSVKKVKSEMQLAINAMWKNQTPQAKRLFPNGKPNLDEFLITMHKALEKQT